MLNNLRNVNTGWMEFFIKFPLVIFFVMPGCIGGFFWIGFQLDSLLHVHILKMVLPGAGSVLGLYITGLLILLGHNKQQIAHQS